MAFDFTPIDGWNNTTSFPQKPANQSVTRGLLQSLFNQTRDYVNGQIPDPGSWTPTFSGTNTYVYQHGMYIKLGSLVVASFDIVLNIKGGDMPGANVRIAGLPFTCINTESGEGFPTLYGLSTGDIYALRVSAATNQIQVYTKNTPPYTELGAVNLTAGSEIVGIVFYKSAS
jgi:hypothetical protein